LNTAFGLTKRLIVIDSQAPEAAELLGYALKVDPKGPTERLIVIDSEAPKMAEFIKIPW
jgi:hypothetical protein